MTHFTVGVGSNATDRQEQMDQALKFLKSTFVDLKVSDVYETPSTHEGQPPYLNCVCVAGTPFTREAVQSMFKRYEHDAGRVKADDKDPNAPAGEEEKPTVAIDLDIVIWDGKIVRPRDFSATYFNQGYRQLLADGAFQFPVS